MKYLRNYLNRLYKYEKDTCNWRRVQKYQGIEQIVARIFQQQRFQKLSRELNAGNSLM